jgi:predicted Zn-dependent protease
VAAGALALTVAIIVSGCGSSAKPRAQIVAGTGFRFSAPAGWTVQKGLTAVTATKGDQFVRVLIFPVAKIYTPKLFAELGAELKVRMTTLAKQTGGTVEGTGVATPDGIKSHVWRVKTGDSLDEYTFVLKGRREYQLLCRRSSGGDDAACVQLVSTFRLT